MPVFATQANIQTTGASVLPIGANGSGKSKLMTAAEIRSAASVYSQAQADAAFVSLAGSYSNPAWITSLANTKITGLGTLATQNGTFSGTSSGTNTGDNAVNSLYSGLVSNATHTGDATGDTALTLATVNSNVGSFGSGSLVPVITVNAKGLITAISTTAVSGGGGGITSINGDATAAQLLTVGTAGTNFAIDSTTTPGTSVFNIPDASATARGLITTGTQTFAGVKTFATVNATDFNISGYGLDNSGALNWTLNYPSSSTLSLKSVSTIGWCSGNAGGTSDAVLARDAAGILAQRNSTNAQTFRVYNTYTSSTSFETLQIQNVASTGTRIGYAIGSAGGTGGAARQLDFGRWNAAGTWSSLLTWDANDFLTLNTRVQVGTATGADACLVVGNTGTIQIADGAGYVFTSNGYIASSGVSVPISTAITASFTTRSGVGNSGRTAAYHSTYLTTIPSTSFYDWRFAAASSNSTTSLMRLAFDGTFTLTQPVSTSGSPTGFNWTGGAHTTLALSTEATDVNFNLARTVQFATGALTTQRAMRIQAPTYSFVGASTITTASTLSISGAPVAGTNATITNPFALVVESGTTYFNGSVRFGAYTSFTSGPDTWTFEQNSSMVWGGRSMSPGSDWVFTGPTSFSYRNGTSAVSSRIFTTYTSATSYERLNIKGVASANFEIGPENGSAGGTLRGLTLGGYSAGSSTITPWLTFDATGTAAFVGTGTTIMSAATWEFRNSGGYLNSIYSSNVAAKINIYDGSFFLQSNATYDGRLTCYNDCLIEVATGKALYVGNGRTSASPFAGNVYATGGSGTDIAGAALTVAGGRGTGTGAGGSVKIQVAPAGSTGSALNALVDAVVVDSTKLATFSGQVIETPPASVTLATNGQFSVEMTSNTAGNLVYRGSDGTTRRAALVFV